MTAGALPFFFMLGHFLGCDCFATQLWGETEQIKSKSEQNESNFERLYSKNRHASSKSEHLQNSFFLPLLRKVLLATQSQNLPSINAIRPYIRTEDIDNITIARGDKKYASPHKEGITTMKNTKMNSCTIDHENSSIICGKSFMKNASHYGTDEYKELLSIKHDFPNYEVKVEEPQKAVDKKSMKGLTREFMEYHIVTLYGKDSDRHKEFLNQKKMSEAYKNSYMYLRKWFDNKYPNWDGKEEQRQKAREKKAALRILPAEKSSAEAEEAAS